MVVNYSLCEVKLGRNQRIKEIIQNTVLIPLLLLLMLCSCIGYALHKLGIEKIKLEFGDGEIYIDIYRKSYVSPRTYIPTFEALLSKKTALYSMTVARARYGSSLLCYALVYTSKLYTQKLWKTQISKVEYLSEG